MCGLVGVMGKIDHKAERVFKELLVIDSIRGPHSTGVMFLPTFSDPTILKKAVDPWEFFQYRAFNDGLNKVNSLLVGHNRWATTGDINNINAHPFECDNIIGVHNGTLVNQKLLDDHKCFEVDSENIFHHMSINGVEHTIQNLHGAFALAWYNKDDRTLNFIRNEERPLTLALTKDNKTIYWASERWMLEASLGRAGIEIDVMDSLEVGQHLSFDIPREALHSSGVLDKPVAKKIDLFVPPPTVKSADTWRGGEYGHYGKKWGGGNVVAHPKLLGGSSSVSSELSEKLSKLVNKTVEFEVCGTVSATNLDYIDCSAIGDCNIKLRCYAETDSTLWSKMLNSCKTFEGRAKYHAVSYGYLVLDKRTIEEVELQSTPYEEEFEDYEGYRVGASYEDEDYAIGYTGKLLTREEFYAATEDGCCCCIQKPLFEEWDDLSWVSKDTFVCEDCRGLDGVSEYVN